jgi:hypothetical protein
VNALKRLRTCLLAGSVVGTLQPLQRLAEEPTSTARDGRHDFDFEIGTWKTHLSRLLHRLTGSNTWVEYEGTTIVRKIWDGRANLVELKADGPAGHFEGLSLRLYSPQSHQWNLNFAGVGGGTLSQPTVGEINNGRGEFSTRKRSMDVPSSFDFSHRTSLRIRGGLSNLFRMMEARLGK